MCKIRLNCLVYWRVVMVPLVYCKRGFVILRRVEKKYLFWYVEVKYPFLL